MYKKLTFATCVALLTLTACQGTPMMTNMPVQSQSQSKNVQSQNQNLYQRWAIDGVITVKDNRLNQLPSGTFVSFHQDKADKHVLVHASIGCNGKSGQAIIDKTKQTIALHGQMTSTLMSCGDLDGIEDALGDFMAGLTSYHFDKEKLILMDKAGNALAFHAMTINGDWQLMDSQGFDVLPNQTVSLSLKDGKGHAHAGCNQLSFAYQDLGGQKIKIGGIASTRMACMDVPFEQALVGFLPTVVRYQWRDGRLTLIDKDGKNLVFAPKP